MTNNIEQLRQVASNQMATSLAAAKAAKEAQAEIDRQEKLAAKSQEALQTWLFEAMETQLQLGLKNPALAQEIVRNHSEDPAFTYLSFAVDLLSHPIVGYQRNGNKHYLGDKEHTSLDDLKHTIAEYIGHTPANTQAPWVMAILTSLATEEGTPAQIRRLSIMAAQKAVEGIQEPEGLTLSDTFKARALLGLEVL